MMQYKAIKTRLYLSRNETLFLRMLMHSAKSLYNQALYNVRQYFIKHKEYLSYQENYKLLSKTSEHYRMLNTQQGQTIITKRMISLMEKRNNQMTYGIHKAAKLIMEHAISNHVGTIIIGYNDGFKDINLSDQYNQWSRSIPIARLRDRIIYLAKSCDIETAVINEAYTSKASYIDQDEIPEGFHNKKTSFTGNRTKRGLYVSKDGIHINADLNAALNILRKGKPDAIRIGSNGWNTPKRTFLF